MTDTEKSNWAIDIDERADGFYTRFESEFYSSDKWIGPYPTKEAAMEAVTTAITNVMTDIAKVMLGI